MIEAFPKGGGTFQIEPDASSGSYFMAAGIIALDFFKPSGGRKVKILSLQPPMLDIPLSSQPDPFLQRNARLPSKFFFDFAVAAQPG